MNDEKWEKLKDWLKLMKEEYKKREIDDYIIYDRVLERMKKFERGGNM